MRIRLVLAFALIVLVALLTVMLIARQGTVEEVRAFMIRGGMVQSEDLVASLEAYYQAQGSWAGVESVLGRGGQGRGMMGRGQGNQGMTPAMMSQRLRLADSDGTVIVDTAQAGAAGELSQSELGQAIALNADGRIVGYLLSEGGMGFDSVSEQLLLSRLNRAVLVAALAAGGLSLLLSLILAAYILRPVTDLTQAARRLGAGELEARVPERGQSELSLLGRTFNQMAASLQQVQESRKALTSDIAHELRTPLAVQRAHLEALQDEVFPLTVDSLQPVLDQNLLLTRLVGDLRTLAMAESGQLKLERVPVDLAGLVGSVINRFEPQAVGAQVHLEIQVEPKPAAWPAEVQIDPGRVEQILMNLLSNALRFTPPGGSIRTHLSYLERTASQPRAVQVTIHDSGPGIPDGVLPYIFDRFFRADKGRDRLEGGAGLGLAIARQLAEAHHGSLEAGNHPSGGAIFTLVLPYETE